MNAAFFKRNWYYFAPAVLLLIPVLIMFYYVMSFGYSFGESWNAMTHMSSSATRYPVHYKDRNFDKVKLGDDGRSVYQKIGIQPFEGHVGGRKDWRYTLPQSGADCYHERALIMEPDKDGVPRVANIIKRFHLPGMK